MDLGKEKIELCCPSCKRKHNATLSDVSRARIIKCACGTNIQLKDDRGSVKKGINDINKAFKDLEKTFKNFGR